VFFGLLGPLLVSTGESPVTLTAPRPRVMLAALLTRAGRPVGPDELAEVVWDGAPPSHATDTVRTYVMRLRRALGPAAGARIVTRDPGYLIDVAEEELDTLLFRVRYQDGAAAVGRGDWAAARSALAAALALWRGDPLIDVPSDLLRDAEAPALEQARLQALQWRIEADLRLGGGGELVPELWELTRSHPLREDFHAQLMTALVCGGRQAEALAAYQHARQLLVEQLGVEPGSRLRKLHESLLSGDPPPNIQLAEMRAKLS
jgi:DNA-binding SARP family transcriptional activator